ncbi:MAG: beta-ketoacyl-ACP synthase III [Candidatus Omnitrophota bacterium]|nr:ketoacyl-ACP synthase III [Candidatus Omnitrophota bacterium]MBU1928511.1 ketoacyl-ACP synthase III [Candidatus Omnitrophota bacterium]MBU2034716.1 ketoacyl-ACP synthase III [Candidatus Omnitrophota bacterium]
MKKVGVLGVGKYLPEKVLTNADLEKMVDTTDEWITSRTGIKERRLASSLEATSDLAINAAKEALDDAGMKPEDLDLIIIATITPDMQFPSTACFVQQGLGASKAVCFDISAACAGFVYAIACAQQFIARGAYKNALVVGAEKMSSITDWQDRGTCVLFGDGAGAAVLGEVKSGGILSTCLGSNGLKTDLLKLPGGGSRYPATHKTIDERLHYLQMEGNEVFKLAVNIMTEAAREALKSAGLDFIDVDMAIPHQANKRIISALAKKVGLSDEKVYLNIERYGNMSSASTATALCEAVKDGKIKKGDIVLLDAFGAGLVWGACIIKW